SMDLLDSLFLSIRLPRVVAAVLVGSSLSVAGAAFQAMFINPLVSPGILGVLAGASFGAALAMVFSKSWIVVQSSCFIFGFIAVMISMGVARLYKGNTVLLLILGGVISGALFTSLLSIVKYLADPYNQLPAIVYWLMGGLTLVDLGTLKNTAIPVIAGIALIVSLSGYLNVLSMGDEEARTMGVPVERIRFILIVMATMLSAITVVLAGMVGWVGLIIPHMARMIVGPDNRVLIPVSALTGALYLILVDDVSRLAFTTEIPLGIITSLIGIPFFAAVLKRANRGWS
ncbi:MAG TPA: iron ABC transporter permease, partial [Syntrophorhabdaceae bacterium]|nr:iron ABC transporter permease [Syntrophorhabdaceae bacterium]